MGMRHAWGATGAACAALFAMSCGAPHASINDVMGGPAQLIAVDSGPVERARSRTVTVVPFARVKPGRHAFLVRLRMEESSAPAETLLVSATVAAGEIYRFEFHGGALELVKEPEER